MNEYVRNKEIDSLASRRTEALITLRLILAVGSKTSFVCMSCRAVIYVYMIHPDVRSPQPINQSKADHSRIGGTYTLFAPVT